MYNVELEEEDAYNKKSFIGTEELNCVSFYTNVAFSMYPSYSESREVWYRKEHFKELKVTDVALNTELGSYEVKFNHEDTPYVTMYNLLKVDDIMRANLSYITHCDLRSILYNTL